MNLPQLQYFKALAENPRLTDVAKELFIAQSTLSNSIKSLENDLGVELFEHKGHRLELTSSGKVFYRYISHALSTIEEGCIFAKAPDKAASDTVVLGIEPLIRREYARVAIESYKDAAERPNAQFSTVVESYEGILSGLRSGSIDAGMVLTDTKTSDLLCEKVGKYSLTAVLNVNHPLADKPLLSMADITKSAIVSYHPNSPLAGQIKPILDTYGIQVARYLEDDSALCAELCRDSTVIGLMRSTTEIKLYRQITFKPIAEVTDFLFGTYFVAKKPPYRTDEVERFVSYISTVNFPSAERIVKGASLS